MTDWAEPPLTMNWTDDLQAWPLPDEKVHMLEAQPGVMLTKPWPLPQSILTEVEPGMVTASHQTDEPPYHVRERSLDESHGHGHSQLSLAAATANKAERASAKRSANRTPEREMMEAIVWE